MSFDPRKAEYAVVGQTLWSDAALIRAREWLRSTGLAPSRMYWTTVIENELRRNEKPTSTEVKHGQERVREELAKLPNLKAVLLMGSYAAKMAFSLKGGITRVHGQSGKLALVTDDPEEFVTEVDCVACLHPSYVGRQKSLRQQQLLDSDCRAVVSRLTYVSKPLVLPDIRVEANDEKLIGRFGLDTETEFQVGKKVDPRRDPLLITGLSDGSIFVGAPEVLDDAEPIAHNMPFDAVLIDQWKPKWHDSKMLAHLIGMYDTTLKGAASRILGRPMMEYDPDLRVRAATKIRAGMSPAGDTDVKVFMGYCLATGTRVLAGDFYWRPIEEMEVGDTIWGLDEHAPSGKGSRRKLRLGIVERTMSRTAHVYRIVTDRGSILATAEHPFLVRDRWRPTSNLKPGDRIRYISPPQMRERSWASGYIAGIFDGDGTLTNTNARHLMLTQNPGKMPLAAPMLSERGYNFSEKAPTGESKGRPRRVIYTRINGGVSEVIRFLAQFHPPRMVVSGQRSFLGRATGGDHATVIKVESVGEREVVNLQTSCHTFFAEGMATHNCAQDALAHRDLFDALWAKADAGAKRLYEEVERPMLRLYARWMMDGVWRLDVKAAKRKRREIDVRIREMRRSLLAETGIESPHSFQKLQQHLGLPTTEAKWIENHWKEFTARQKKVLTLVRELRTIERQVSTYLDAWLEWPHTLLSTNWRPTAAWTGRPGSAHLNLQNIPGPCGSCKLCRRGESRECAFNLRPLLLAPEGMALYELDNSQAELRVAAHLSQDPAMHQAFTEGLLIDGERIFDLHEWAKRMLGFSSRRDAKIRVLATFYGQTGTGARADPMIQEKIRSTFRGYVRWSNKVKRLAIVPGLFGRSLYVPPHPNDAHREREAINAPSQGGAVDVLKIQIADLEDGGLYTRHQIHDSVFVSMPEADAGPEVEHEMVRVMEEAVTLTVPLKVDCKRWNP